MLPGNGMRTHLGDGTMVQVSGLQLRRGAVRGLINAEAFDHWPRTGEGPVD